MSRTPFVVVDAMPVVVLLRAMVVVVVVGSVKVVVDVFGRVGIVHVWAPGIVVA
jgi:hypothetical protein